MNKIKIGDWVTVIWHKNNNPYKVTDIWEGDSTKSVNETSNSNSTLFFEDCANRLANQCLPWQPQEGEFIIPENFSKSSTDSFEVIKWKEGYTFKCEPFIGTLPSFLQGK